MKALPLLHLWNACDAGRVAAIVPANALYSRSWVTYQNGCYFYKEDGHQGAALPTYTKALGLVFHHSYLGMNMSHLAHDILETCYVPNSGMTEPKWSGPHGSRRCTKNKTHGIVGTREVSSHGNLFTPTWKSFAQALKSGWARPCLHKILFRMRVPEKFSEFPFFVG